MDATNTSSHFESQSDPQNASRYAIIWDAALCYNALMFLKLLASFLPTFLAIDSIWIYFVTSPGMKKAILTNHNIYRLFV